jgi:hypothetical protein
MNFNNITTNSQSGYYKLPENQQVQSNESNNEERQSLTLSGPSTKSSWLAGGGDSGLPLFSGAQRSGRSGSQFPLDVGKSFMTLNGSCFLEQRSV